MPDAFSQRTNTRRRHTLSIRVRLMILALIAIVPVVVERIHNEEFDRAERIEATQKRVLEVARQGAGEQNQVIVTTRALLQVIADARTEFKFSDTECIRFLTSIAASAPAVRTLSVANVLGKITCSSTPAAIGLDISERAHFTKAVDTAGFVLSDYFPGTRVQEPLITLALAERGVNGAAAAVVLGVLDLSWFEHAAKTFVPPSARMMMFDGNGTVLAQYPEIEGRIGRSFKDHPLVTEMLAHDHGLVTGPSLGGVRGIFGYQKLPGTNARIAFGIDESEVLARVDREMWTGFAELAAVAALVLLGIWFGGERLLVRPIRALAETASRIGHGNSRIHAADLPWAAEFAPLTAALDEMAGKLQAREQELRDKNSQLLELAQTDALTGLANRRTFNERLGIEWKLACKLRQPIAVLMIDVDHFKRFNDHYGHVQGDACLRKVSSVLLSATRAQDGASPPLAPGLPGSSDQDAGRTRNVDFAARYGGEEFAVLLQGADLAIAQMVAERLRAGVEDLLMAHVGAPWGFVSVSIGVISILPSKLDSPQQLIEAADAALYEAKRRDRNQVVGPVPMPLSVAV